MSNPTNAVDGAKQPSGNISFEELVAQRIQARSQPEEEIPEDETPEEVEPEEIPEEEIESEEEPIEGEETEEETEEEGQSEIDLLSLSPEEIQQLAKKGKSRLLQRIGELTAKNRALEEKQQAETKPLPKAIPAEENPFSNLKTVEEVRAKMDELEKVVEETDRVLEDHEDYGADDIINFGGKDFTKKEIRIANRNSRNALLKFLPAQSAEIEKSEQRKGMEEQYNAAIPIEIPELADPESDLSKQFAALIADPLVDQVKQRVPDLAPQIGYLLAHAIRSIHSKPQVKAKPATGSTAKVKVPGNPIGAGAARSSGQPLKKRDAEQAYQNFENTGSVEDWIAARAARKS